MKRALVVLLVVTAIMSVYGAYHIGDAYGYARGFGSGQRYNDARNARDDAIQLQGLIEVLRADETEYAIQHLDYLLDTTIVEELQSYERLMRIVVLPRNVTPDKPDVLRVLRKIADHRSQYPSTYTNWQNQQAIYQTIEAFVAKYRTAEQGHPSDS